MKGKSSIAIFVALIALAMPGNTASSRDQAAKRQAPGSPANPIPFLNQPFVPDATAPGGAAFTLTVNGTGFVSGATVNWNGSPRATTFVSGSQLTAQINAADIATAQTVYVSAANPGTIPSNSMPFQIAFPATTVNFVNTATILTGTYTAGIAAADFNGDGRLDLAVVTTLANSVLIFLGNGDGTFTPGVTIPVGSEPAGIVAADFNGDGKLDLAVTNYISDTISVFLGNGDGTFQTQATFPTGNGPGTLIAADFNGDGKLDLLTEYFGDGTVSVFLGNGDGTFQPGIDSFAALQPSDVVVGDLNGDGRLDLVVSILNGGLSILLGNGDGTFQAPLHNTTPGMGGLTLADFNGDGKLDIAATDGPIGILLGNGDGTFQPPVFYPAPGGVDTLLSGDFNGDSKLDLAVGTSVGVALLLGNGDGTFQPYIDYPYGSEGIGLTAGDFNGDGLLDLVAADFGSSTLSTLLQTTLVVSPSMLAFPEQGVLTTSPPMIVTLTNIGANGIAVGSITITGTNATDFAQTNTCGTSLAGGAACVISVTFTPKRNGRPTASLDISDGAVGSPQQITLSGIADFPSFTITPASLHFGNQTVGTTSKPLTVTLKNTGGVSLAVTSLSFSGINASDFAQTNDCHKGIEKGSSCQIRVTFTPSGTGARSGKLVLKGGFKGGCTDVPVNGTGIN